VLGRAALEFMSATLPGSKDQWVHVMPAGDFSGRDGRGPYRLADAAGVIERSRRLAGPREIPIDYEHQTDRAPNNGQPAPAAGWINALQARADGIWARVTWTDRAAAFLARREYRYFSPTFYHTPEGAVVAIVRGALTNTPNLPQLLALASAEERPMDQFPALPETFLPELRQLLGLPETADAAAILAKVREAMTAQQAADPAKFVPIGVLETVVAEVNRLSHGISREAASSHVEMQIRHGNLPPALRAWGVSLCTVNKVAFDAFVDRTKGGFNAIIESQFGTKGLRPASHASRLSDEDRAVCRNMGLTEDELLKARAFSEQAKD
jgi:phage I-like protein